MGREEGHYTIKRVDRLPTKGNSNWLYVIKAATIDKFYRWLPNGVYEEISLVGAGGSASYISNVGLNGTDLEFTGTGLAFNNSVDLSSLVGGSSYEEWATYTGTRAGGDLTVILGDYDGSGNGSTVTIDDSDSVMLSSPNSSIITGNDGGFNIGTVWARPNTVMLRRYIATGGPFDTRFFIGDPTASNFTVTLNSPSGIASDTDLILPLSVNNNYADADGNITVPSGGLNNVVEDTTPQLGGDLDLNGHGITGDGYIDISGSANFDSGITTSTLVTNGNINIQNNKLINLLDGTNPQDAINKGQLDAAIAGVSSNILSKSSTITTSRNALLTDADGYNESTSATDVTITIPENASVAFSIGTILLYKQNGAGKIIIAYSGAATGTVGQTYAIDQTISVIKTATDSWELFNPPNKEIGDYTESFYNQGTEPVLTSTVLPDTAAFEASVDMMLVQKTLNGSFRHYWVKL